MSQQIDPSSPWWVGALIGTITVLAAVIAYLFKLYVGRNKETREEDKEIAKERSDVAVERSKERSEWITATAKERSEFLQQMERQRTEHEKRLGEARESYAAELQEMNDRFLLREDVLRKDFADRIERISSEQTKAAQLQADALQKIREDVIGPVRGRPRT